MVRLPGFLLSGEAGAPHRQEAGLPPDGERAGAPPAAATGAVALEAHARPARRRRRARRAVPPRRSSALPGSGTAMAMDLGKLKPLGVV